jgi:hypothetical protein
MKKPQTGSKTSKPKPCPWCGVTPRVTYRQGLGKWGNVDEAYIYHDNAACPVVVKTQIYATPEQAISAWNSRSTPKQRQEKFSKFFP